MAKVKSRAAKAAESTQAGFRRRAGYQDVLDAPEHKVAEIVDGVLYTQPRPAPLHAYAYVKLGARLENLLNYRSDNGDGGWLVLLEPELHLGEDILVPDLAAWRLERMPEPPATAYFTVAPDWVCEILSPATRVLDQGAKRDVYAREGITHLWFVDPVARTLEVFELRDGHWTLLQSATGETEVAPPPFSATPLQLGSLWWTKQPPAVHEPRPEPTLSVTA